MNNPHKVFFTKNFSFYELFKSKDATKQNIDNEPKDFLIIHNLKQLTINVLQPVRDRFGPTEISSAYRCDELNKFVGGSETSQHKKGEAADIEVYTASTLELALWIYKNLDFDQLILEHYDPNIPHSGWVHVSYCTGKPNRKQFLKTTRTSKGKLKYIPYF